MSKPDVCQKKSKPVVLFCLARLCARVVGDEPDEGDDEHHRQRLIEPPPDDGVVEEGCARRRVAR